MSTFRIRLMQRDDWEEVARLIHVSLNTWYAKNRGYKLTGEAWEPMLLFPRVYESLDPGCCVLAADEASGRIAGSCFFHPRPTHVALGIMNTHPDFFGRGVGSLMLRYIIDLTQKRGQPLRLVSGATNVDSFSLYNKAGFMPTRFFQDMTVKVPEEGFEVDVPDGCTVREAVEADIPGMVALERELVHIDREQDFRFFLKNEGGIWHSSVLIGPDGRLDGFLHSVADPGSNMLGPGLARTEEQGIALVQQELGFHRGRSPVWLVPTHSRRLVDAMYALGARNCELHISQILGTQKPEAGIIFPTFMPETA